MLNCFTVDLLCLLWLSPIYCHATTQPSENPQIYFSGLSIAFQIFLLIKTLLQLLIIWSENAVLQTVQNMYLFTQNLNVWRLFILNNNLTNVHLYFPQHSAPQGSETCPKHPWGLGCVELPLLLGMNRLCDYQAAALNKPENYATSKFSLKSK